MANWKYTLDLSDIYHIEDPTDDQLKELALEIVKRIKKTLPASMFDFESDEYDYDINDIVELFEDVSQFNSDETDIATEFDGVLAELYDWADMNVPPYGEWPRNAMMWVKIF